MKKQDAKYEADDFTYVIAKFELLNRLTRPTVSRTGKALFYDQDTLFLWILAT